MTTTDLLKLKRIELKKIQLGDIQDIHPCLKKLEEELSVPPFRTPRSNSFSPESLLSLLDYHQFTVAASKKSFKCIGNIRLYRLAIQLLSPDTMVPVFVLRSRCSQEEIKQRYLNELFLMPAIHHISSVDVGLLRSLWEKHILSGNKNLENPLKCTNNKDFTRTYRIYNSTSKKK